MSVKMTMMARAALPRLEMGPCLDISGVSGLWCFMVPQYTCSAVHLYFCQESDTAGQNCAGSPNSGRYVCICIYILHFVFCILYLYLCAVLFWSIWGTLVKELQLGSLIVSLGGGNTSLDHHRWSWRWSSWYMAFDDHDNLFIWYAGVAEQGTADVDDDDVAAAHRHDNYEE